MLKLSLKPGEYITLGDNIKIIFSEGSANNIHLLVDALREINVARNSADRNIFPAGTAPIIDQEIPAIRFSSGRTLCHRRGRRNGGCPGNDNLYLIVFIRKYLKMILCHIFFQRKRPDQFLCLRIKSCKYCDQIAFPSLSKMCLAT